MSDSNRFQVDGVKMKGKEYAKELNKLLLENNDLLSDNFISVDAIMAPKIGTTERGRLQKLFFKLRLERKSDYPHMSEHYIHFESARGIDWDLPCRGKLCMTCRYHSLTK